MFMLYKYLASIIGLCVFAAPFYFVKEPDSKLSTEEYVRSIRLLMNTSNAIGELVLIYKRVTTLAGFTSCVSELLESVKMLSAKDGKVNANTTSTPIANDELLGDSNGIQPHPPLMVLDEIIKFDNVTVFAPDGTLLVRELSFEVLPGNSVIIMGPNGSGKSSLLRVLAELWPLQSGTINKPPVGKIFSLSQRPYVVRGTLRDQVRYPDLLQDSLKLPTTHSPGSQSKHVLLLAGSAIVLMGGKLLRMKMKALQNEQEDLYNRGVMMPRQKNIVFFCGGLIQGCRECAIRQTTQRDLTLVNIDLKAMWTIISLSFQKVLTEHLHQAYRTNHPQAAVLEQAKRERAGCREQSVSTLCQQRAAFFKEREVMVDLPCCCASPASSIQSMDDSEINIIEEVSISDRKGKVIQNNVVRGGMETKISSLPNECMIRALPSDNFQ
ncbi:hypothetical protein KI387_005535, partial [Taxus chinensis]